jgi:hypothetical protein
VPKTQFKIKGLKRWRAALDAHGFDEVARKNIRKATALNGKIIEAAVRKVIQSGKLKANAPLTIAIKGSSKPLVDHGGLFQAVTSHVVDDFTVFVGVLRSSPAHRLVEMLHEGVVISVTPAMRGMFFMLWRASIGEIDPNRLTGRAAELWARMPRDWKPLATDTKKIVIPPRRFIKAGFRTAGIIALCRKNWKAALEASFRARKNAGKGLKDE